MSLIQPYGRRTAPVSSPAGSFFLRSFGGLASIATSLGSAWRMRSNLLLLESLPDDLRKDIGWPDGGHNR